MPPLSGDWHVAVEHAGRVGREHADRSDNRLCRFLHNAVSSGTVQESAQGEAMARQITVRTAGDLGAAVAEARHNAGLSQAQVSEQTGVPRTYLARFEAGLTVAFVERALLVLRRLGAQIVVTLPDRTL